VSRTESAPAQGGASIATVERETGLSKDTLRVWERRYGFPTPTRDGHGERLYPPEQVEKLRVIRRLLDRGIRPRELVKVPLHELIARVQDASLPAGGGREAPDEARAALMEETIGLLKRYDETGLAAHLARVLLRLGLQRFVIEFAAPLNERVGEAWSRGELAVSQEHLYSEHMQHVLRGGIGSIPRGARQPSVVLTTLPGEEHQLGLLMAHVCLAAEGARCISLGVRTPASDIAHTVAEQGIDVVGLSFSEALKLNVAYDMLEDLRGRLPPSVDVWAGGKLWTRARRPLPGVRFITRLTEIPEVLAAHRESRMKHSDRRTRAPE
jgi:DNA-binding transcriptional MerR regulator/methylmalonyl-CoA mutase cobalamin-binding subunit